MEVDFAWLRTLLHETRGEPLSHVGSFRGWRPVRTLILRTTGALAVVHSRPNSLEMDSSRR